MDVRRRTIVAWCLFGLLGSAAAAAVDFPDPWLEAAVREALGIPSGPISDEALLDLTELQAFPEGEDARIVDLTGLEYAQHLRTLWLQGHRLHDLDPLQPLSELVDLALDNNRIVDIEPLVHLSGQLINLQLAGNPLGPAAYCDLETLAGNNPGAGITFDNNPHPPAGLSASQDTYVDHIRVTWDPRCIGPLEGEQSHYRLYRAPEGEPEAPVPITDWIPSTAFNDWHVTPGGRYRYWVRGAWNAYGAGQTAASDPVLGTVAVPEGPPPVVTTLPPGEVGPDRVTLAARLEEAGDPTAEVRFRYRPGGGPWEAAAWSCCHGSGDLIVTVLTGLLPETDYEVAAQARNDTGADTGETRTFRTLPADGDLGPWPVIESGPLVDLQGPERAVVTWTTNVPCAGVLRVGARVGAEQEIPTAGPPRREHAVWLTDLAPGRTYQVQVRGQDPWGRSVESPWVTFETAPPVATDPPALRLSERAAGAHGIDLVAAVQDPVERLVFRVDDERVLTDYSPPYVLHLDVTEYDSGPHRIRAEAFDRVGRVGGDERIVPVQNPAQLAGPRITFVKPATGAVITQQFVPVQAQVHDDAGLVSVNLFVYRANTQVDADATVYGTPWPHDTTASFTWNTVGVPDGSYRIILQAVADGGRITTAERAVTLLKTPAPPKIPLPVIAQRRVSRSGNRFTVRLTIRNDGQAEARQLRILDGLQNFQPLIGSDAAATYSPSVDPLGAWHQCTIAAQQALAPGASRVFTYQALPVLTYPTPPVYPQTAIGPFTYLSFDSPTHSGYSRTYAQPATTTTAGVPLRQAYAQALAGANLLIVTNPERLGAVFAPGWYGSVTSPTKSAVNTLLSTCAELAAAKGGALGYIYTYTTTGLHALLKQGGAWNSRLAPGWTSQGALLLVGETEIVPAWGKQFTYHYTGGQQVWTFVSDYRYASTTGDDYVPELNLGRAVGNSPDALRTVLRTSLQQSAGYRWRRSLLASGEPGSPPNQIDFKAWVQDALKAIQAKSLGAGSSQTTIDRPTVADLFKETPGQDVLFLAGHGNAVNWAGVGAGDVAAQANPFGTATPVVFAHSCETAMYAGHSSLAEAFLQQGAGAYIGATESGGWGQYSKAFWQHWDPGESAGQGLRQTKRSLGSAWLDHFWNALYHLFGDPTFGAYATGTPAPVPAPPGVAPADPPVPDPVLEVHVPDYESAPGPDGHDRVSLPGGGVLTEPHHPVVPTYTVTRSYPAGTRIQTVRLVERAAPLTERGLDLPQMNLTLPREVNLEVPAPNEPLDWWPAEPYTWHGLEDPDGTTLVLTVHPLAYHRYTRESRFYPYYRFTVSTTPTPLRITALRPEREVLVPGEVVTVDLDLRGEGAGRDVVVACAIRNDADERVADGLGLRSLHDLTGAATYSLTWDTTGLAPGVYRVEATLRTPGGDRLDRAERVVWLGRRLVEVTELTVSPAHPAAGAETVIRAVYANGGTVPVSGRVVVTVGDGSGRRVHTSGQSFAELVPGAAAEFTETWTRPVAGGPWTVTAQVVYDGRACEPRHVTVPAGE